DRKRFARAKFHSTGLDGASVRAWASLPLTQTGCLNALVHGGRCVNEDPYSYATGPGADIDISGCYGASLRALTFPIGLPTYSSYQPNERGPTLGNWLKRHEKDLVPGTWTCVVSGPLPFEQDLLFSKLVKQQSLRRVLDKDGSDPDAQMVLKRREVKNA